MRISTVYGRPIPLTAFVLSAVFLLLVAFPAVSQETGSEITVPSHWSRYQAPTSYPEGTEIHIIVEGDTLWDLAGRYFENPFLWPQLWDANRYVENPHLIYPGDPLSIPDLDVIRSQAIAAGETGPGGPGGGPGGAGTGPGGAPGGGPGGLPGTGAQGPAFYPAYEEQTIACAGYIGPRENEDMRIVGSEEGGAKVALASSDIVYINKGTNDGVSPGDRFFVQRRVSFGWGLSGAHIVRSGGVVVLAAQENSAMAEVTASCTDMWIGDYLIPFEPIPVPLLPKQPLATRLTPETGQMRGEIVASLDEIGSPAEGYLVSIDLGEGDGVVPGNILTVFPLSTPRCAAKSSRRARHSHRAARQRNGAYHGELRLHGRGGFDRAEITRKLGALRGALASPRSRRRLDAPTDRLR